VCIYFSGPLGDLFPFPLTQQPVDGAGAKTDVLPRHLAFFTFLRRKKQQQLIIAINNIFFVCGTGV
jgi:hypothetical protein